MNSLNITKSIVSFLLVLFSLSAVAFEETGKQWKRIKNKDGIQVFRSHSENSRLKTFRVEARMELEDIRSYVSVLLDGESFPKWGHMISSAEVIKKGSDKDYEVYLTTRLPWPVKNRHVKYDYHISQTDDYSLRFDVTKSEIPPPERKGYILSPEAFGYFTLKTIPDSKEVKIITEIFIDPGGYVPAFLVNLITDDLSFYSTKKLRKYVQKEEYDNNKINFIKRRPWALE